MKSTNFNDFKNNVLAKKIGRKPVSLSNIRLISDSAVEIDGLALALSPAGFSSLLKIVGISKKLRKNLIVQYGASFADNLVSKLGTAMGDSKSDVILLIDMRKRKVVNIVTSSESMISNESYLNNVESIISGTNLEIDALTIRDNGGFTVSTVGDKSEWGLMGASNNETFKFGLNFDNDPVKGTRLMPYNQRLVCTNGMIGDGFVGVHQLTNDKDSWDSFYHKIDVLKKDNFKPIEFNTTLKSVMGADASVAELTNARNLMKANSKVTDIELEKYAPIDSTLEAYRKNGIDTDNFNKDQRENAKTDVSYWELINGLTDFASHNYGYEVKGADTLQRFAGRMFIKKPDLTNLVINPFKK